jgi:tRNA(Leu) C34 or U34 (ribose-2'-O)-methylase TrmL
MKSRGFFGIGIYQPKKDVNIGTLWRSAHILGASYIYTIGNKYHRQASDTTAAYKNIPLFEYKDFEHFQKSIPRDTKLVAVELDEKAIPIEKFAHIERAVYLLGSERIGLPKEVLNGCDTIVQLPGEHCLNVSVCGSIIMYDRMMKLKK